MPLPAHGRIVPQGIQDDAPIIHFEGDVSCESDWQHAGVRIHMLGGLFLIDSERREPRSPDGALLLASYEAEQHLLHFGRSNVPVCWTICGLISGYFSATDPTSTAISTTCASSGHGGATTTETSAQPQANDSPSIRATKRRTAAPV